MRARKSFPTTLALTALLGFGLLSQAVLADPPPLTPDGNGSYVATVTSAPIFDLSASQEISDGSGTLRTEIVLSPGGKITGGSTDVRSGGFESQMVLKGSAKGANGTVKVTTKAHSFIRINGETDSTATQSFKGTVDSSGTYSGTLSTRYCDKSIGCTTVSLPIRLSLGSGAWGIKLTLDGQGTSVFGAVTITTSVESQEKRRDFNYVAAGKYSPRTGIATLKLSPADGSGAPKLKLKVRMTPSGGIEPWALDSIVDLSGKLLGQKIAVK